MENAEPRPQRPPKNQRQQKGGLPSSSQALTVAKAAELLARRKARNKRKREKRKFKQQFSSGKGSIDYLTNTISGFAKGIELGEGSINWSRLPAPIRIALGIAIPILVPPSRMVSEYSDSNTAIANPFERVLAQWSVNSQTLPSFLFRNAERFSVLYDANPNDANWEYAISGTNLPTQLPSTTWITPMTTDVKEYLHTPYASSVEDYEPHGEVLLAGAAKEAPAGRFFWLNDLDILAGTIALPVVAGTTYNVAVDLDFWSSKTGVLQDQVHFIAAQGIAGTAFGTTATCENMTGWMGQGYYALKFSYEEFIATEKTFNSEVNVTFSNWSISGTGPCWGHRPAPGYFQNVTSCDGVRFEGVAVRYCNVAAMLNLEGQVSVLQCPQNKTWQDFIEYTVLSSAMGAKAYDVRDGAYVFLKPTQPEDFDYQSFTTSSGGMLTDVFYPLKEQSAFLATIPNIKTNDGRSGFFEIATGVEYQTTDVWRNVGPPTDTIEDRKKAMLLVRDLPQYYRNTTHVADIMHNMLNGVKTGVRTAVKYGPSVLNVLKNLSMMAGV